MSDSVSVTVDMSYDTRGCTAPPNPPVWDFAQSLDSKKLYGFGTRLWMLLVLTFVVAA